MKLHANAALSLTQRRRMVQRVLDQGWSIKAACFAGASRSQRLGQSAVVRRPRWQRTVRSAITSPVCHSSSGTFHPIRAQCRSDR
jgi:hypothetical protein